jgi:hypothetical protein
MTLSNQDNWDHSSEKTQQDPAPNTETGPVGETAKNVKKQDRRQFSRLDNNRFFD